MKATLDFDLPEERYEFELASNAAAYRSVLFDFDQALRSKIKYTDETETTYGAVRDMLYEFLTEEGIDLYSDRG